MSHVVEYQHRSISIMTDLNTAYKRKDKSRQNHIVEDHFPTTLENQALVNSKPQTNVASVGI